MIFLIWIDRCCSMMNGNDNTENNNNENNNDENNNFSEDGIYLTVRRKIKIRFHDLSSFILMCLTMLICPITIRTIDFWRTGPNTCQIQYYPHFNYTSGFNFSGINISIEDNFFFKALLLLFTMFRFHE